MHFLANESGTDRPQEQMVAICMQSWRDRGKDSADTSGLSMKKQLLTDRKSLPLEIKSLAAREFEGYASVFGNVDLGGDIVQPGAFVKSLTAHTDAGTLPQMFWMHDPSRIPGKWLNMEEDDHGLYCRGVLAPTPLGDEMHALLKMDAVRGLSIGYMIEEDDYNKDGNRLLKQVDLWETSLVSLAMNPLAHVTGTKSQLSVSGEYVPTPRELEQFFRQKFSRRVSRLLVAKILADDSSSGTLEAIASKLFGREEPARATPAGSRWDAGNSEEVERALSQLRDSVIADTMPQVFTT